MWVGLIINHNVRVTFMRRRVDKKKGGVYIDVTEIECYPSASQGQVSRINL